MRGILGRRRGADGRFCRGIPGFLGGVRVRRGGSAYGGHGRVLGAKKFLKIFKKGAKNLKIGGFKEMKTVKTLRKQSFYYLPQPELLRASWKNMLQS